MSTKTTNYGLTKPERSDNYNVDVMGNNMDIIDSKLKEYNNAINGGNIKGNLTGNVTGNVTGFVFVKGAVGTSGDADYATCAAQTINLSTSQTSSSSYNSTYINGYSIISFPKRHTWGVYTRKSDLTGTLSPTISSRTLTFKATMKETSSNTYFTGGTTRIYYKKSTDSSWSVIEYSGSSTKYNTNTVLTYPSITVTVGATYYFYSMNYNDMYSDGWYTLSGTVSAGTTYKIKYATP